MALANNIVDSWLGRGRAETGPRRGGPPGPRGSQVQPEPLPETPGDTDQHGLARLPLLVREHRVPVVRGPIEDIRLAGPAGALGAGEEHLDARAAHGVEHGDI